MKPCFMRDLHGDNNFKNNEEYRRHLKKVNRIYLLLSIAGLLLAALGAGAEILSERGTISIAIDDYMLGVYCGAGVGLLVAGIVIQIRNRRIMKDEEKLTKARREQGDERIQEISRRANRVATLVMIFGLYAVSLIGGLFYPILTKILLFIICLFLVSYVISYRILDKRM